MTTHTVFESRPFGNWFVSQEGQGEAGLVVKRAMFDHDGNPAGYELLDGDYAEVARIVNAHDELVAALREVDALMRECYLGPVCNYERWADGGEARIMAAQKAVRAALAKVAP